MTHPSRTQSLPVWSVYIQSHTFLLLACFSLDVQHHPLSSPCPEALRRPVHTPRLTGSCSSVRRRAAGVYSSDGVRWLTCPCGSSERWGDCDSGLASECQRARGQTGAEESKPCLHSGRPSHAFFLLEKKKKHWQQRRLKPKLVVRNWIFDWIFLLMRKRDKLLQKVFYLYLNFLCRSFRLSAATLNGGRLLVMWL